MKKIALYIDPDISHVSIFYTKILLKQEFENRGYIFNIYIPTVNKLLGNDIHFPYFNQFHNKYLKYPIIWDIPKKLCHIYDILFLVQNRNKKYNTIRNKLANEFTKLNKPVIAIKDELTMDCTPLDNEKIIYCCNTKNHINLLPTNSVPLNAKRFVIPTFTNLSYEKENSLTFYEFCSLYSLDKYKKIILFFLPRYPKFKKILKNLDVAKPLLFFLNHFDEINQIVNRNGFQFILKSHKGDMLLFQKEFMENISHINISTIQPIHTYEAIKYSSFAITALSNIVYELYLNNLPTLELCSNKYYPNWYCNFTEFPFKNINPNDLIYGELINFEKFENNTEEYILELLNKKYDISQFKYLKNHPIYGDSYNVNIKDIVDVIIQNLLNN